MNKITNIPRTIGLIMDGNGRWATERGQQRMEGHTSGIVNMITLACHAFDLGVKNFVCYGLSTENLKRPSDEVEHIYKLMIDIFDYFVEALSKVQACVKYIGNTALLPDYVVASMERSRKALSKFESTGKTLHVAIAYGGRAEIIDAVNAAVAKGEPVTEQSLLGALSCTVEPELIIRPGGEKRLSNFLLYQISYSELYFSDKYFPEFNCGDLDAAIEWYSKRNRRFGGVK